MSRADSTERLSRGLRSRLADAKAVAPVPCAPVVALADSALALADSTNAELRRASLGLQGALDSTTTALSSLRASQVKLSASADVLVKAARPPLLLRLLPKPGIGIAAGVNAMGQPQIIVGVTLGWGR